MARIVVEEHIDAPPAAVWRRLADIADHVSWMADAAEIRFTGDRHEGVGTTFECVTRLGPLHTLDVMEVTAWTTSGGWASATGAWSPAPGRSRSRPRTRGRRDPPCVGRGPVVPVVARRAGRRRTRPAGAAGRLAGANCAGSPTWCGRRAGGPVTAAAPDGPRAGRPHMPGYGVSGPADGTGLLPWSWAEERLSRSHDYVLATVRPDGHPHAMPVWGVWLDGRCGSAAGCGRARPATWQPTGGARPPPTTPSNRLWSRAPPSGSTTVRPSRRSPPRSTPSTAPTTGRTSTTRRSTACGGWRPRGRSAWWRATSPARPPAGRSRLSRRHTTKRQPA